MVQEGFATQEQPLGCRMEFIGGRSVIEKTNAEDAKVSLRAQKGAIAVFAFSFAVFALDFVGFF
jgi:hypothetical protein